MIERIALFAIVARIAKIFAAAVTRFCFRHDGSLPGSYRNQLVLTSKAKILNF